MVIMDDAQARGFLFSYEKLFGAKAQSDTGVKNKREGKDTSITRTARFFYDERRLLAQAVDVRAVDVGKAQAGHSHAVGVGKALGKALTADFAFG